jgi:Ca-activated chloride channel family protein
LSKLAEAHHGTSQYVEPDENLETALASFYEKIKSPVMSDVKIAYSGIDVKNIYPKEVKDIFAGSQVLFLGRYKKGGAATVSLTGKVNGSEKALSFPLNFSTTQPGNSHLVKLWAMRRIGYLTDVAQANGENREVIDEIIALSKQHGIISQYTSYLVTDPSENHRLVNAPRPTPTFDSPLPATSFGRAVGRLSSRPSASSRREIAMSMREGASASALSGAFAAGGAGGDSGFSKRLSSNKLDKSGFYSAPRQMQIVDERPSMDDFRVAGAMPQSGQKAVIAAKEMNVLKNSHTLLAKARDREGLTQFVDDKTFVLRGTTWVDTTYNEKTSAKPKEIEFGSQKYFELLKVEPGLSRYLSLGKELIVNYKGNIYKIVQPRTATS